MLSIGALGFNPVWAESDMEEVVVKGDLGLLPGDKVESVFGFKNGLSPYSDSKSQSWIPRVLRRPSVKR